MPTTSDPIVFALVVLGASAAAAIDLASRRVPNLLTGSLAVAGLLLAGLQITRSGLPAAAGGLLVGACLMLPGHLVGRTGAGDVKLLAALGTLLGPVGVTVAFVYTLIAGGLLALVVAAQRRSLLATIAHTVSLVRSGGAHVAEIERPSADNRFAYAPAIALGACLAVIGA